MLPQLGLDHYMGYNKCGYTYFLKGGTIFSPTFSMEKNQSSNPRVRVLHNMGIGYPIKPTNQSGFIPILFRFISIFNIY
jgi:hypothetical protein